MIEFLVIAVVGGLLLAVVLMVLIWAIVGRAVGNLLDWLILTFGNPDAVEEVKRRRAGESSRGGGHGGTLG